MELGKSETMICWTAIGMQQKSYEDCYSSIEPNAQMDTKKYLNNAKLMAIQNVQIRAYQF
jgi:hypothetical protein